MFNKLMVMKIELYQVDAFSSKIFGGNPAAVCPLQQWLSDDMMQRIAAENNLSETAFIVPENDGFYIKWFTPTTEIALCGHATLAAAHVLYHHLGYKKETIHFNCKSGPLEVYYNNDQTFTLNFPCNQPEAVTNIPDGLFEGLGIATAPVFKSVLDYMVVLPSAAAVLALTPDFKTLAKVNARGVIVTAEGIDCDFVSRCFYPQSGVDEDPVTGSAHTILTPYWAAQLHKTKLSAQQLSARKGHLECELKENRVHMTGKAVTYMTGSIFI